ncbi:CRISPR-associated protein Cas2 [Thermodesulfovibrio aggregans]|uniref:CRISPR-associated endoribonuclease Cas2 n=1 Tax=Thermodesulfovibrio aggregans TaxID=86166 RepID=A0A0U9HSW4_9BACT|nr:CRISPR-associated endonuclease Cas2 [Thermodesulfovibrio aggregans]GAQ95513.1 CRISPR-associated protein Cas2 [Thermodesulfovibrio aggregans]
MKVILVYDINEKRVAKVLKICRKYLHWVQNSVFEGEISEAKLVKLKMELKKIINENEDSVIIYTFRSAWYTNRETMGVKKGGEELII